MARPSKAPQSVGRPPGRPPIGDETMTRVTVALPVGVVDAAEARARRDGSTRAAVLRDVLARDLQA